MTDIWGVVIFVNTKWIIVKLGKVKCELDVFAPATNFLCYASFRNAVVWLVDIAVPFTILVEPFVNYTGLVVSRNVLFAFSCQDAESNRVFRACHSDR